MISVSEEKIRLSVLQYGPGDRRVPYSRAHLYASSRRDRCDPSDSDDRDCWRYLHDNKTPLSMYSILVTPVSGGSFTVSLYTDDQCENEIGMVGPVAKDGLCGFSANASEVTFQSFTFDSTLCGFHSSKYDAKIGTSIHTSFILIVNATYLFITFRFLFSSSPAKSSLKYPVISSVALISFQNLQKIFS